MRSKLIALSTFILPLAMLFDRNLFRDEMLYVYLSRVIREDPSIVYPVTSVYVPHPPGFLYRLAMFNGYWRLAAFTLSAISFVLLYVLDDDGYIAMGSALPAFYSAIVFDDAPGAFLAAAAAVALYKHRRAYSAVLFFIASWIRFQSYFISALYALMLAADRKSIGDAIVPLAGLPAVASFFVLYPNPLPHLIKPPYRYSFSFYVVLLFLPHTLLLLLPLTYKDREAMRMIIASYLFNALTRNIFDRYYLTTIDFISTRVHEGPKRYKYLAAVSILPYAMNRRELIVMIIGALLILRADNDIEAYLIANRFLAFALSYHALLYALPHPCMRHYLEKIGGSRGYA